MGAELLPWVLTSGWASGVNSYAVVLMMGILGRFGFDAVPATLERTDVMAVAGVLFAAELVADKVPYVDSLWDSVHTVIRPVVGAAVGALLAGDAGSMQQAVMATTGGLSALASHLVKTGLRTAVNTSPEPVSNIVLSTGEDVTVAGVISLAVLNPWAAASIAGVLLVAGVVLVVVLWRRIRRARERWRAWRDQRFRGAPPSTAP